MRSHRTRSNAHSRLSLLTAAVFASAALLVGASAASANHGQPDKLVPIHGANVGTDYIIPGAADCPPEAGWRFVAEGNGTMSHLGRVDVAVTHCTFPDTPPPDITTGTFGPGLIEITAANGDQLRMTESGWFEVVLTPDGPLAFAYLDWDVLDGTGRFEGATGSGTAVSVSDLMGGNYTTYTGHIAYDASNH